MDIQVEQHQCQYLRGINPPFALNVLRDIIEVKFSGGEVPDDSTRLSFTHQLVEAAFFMFTLWPPMGNPPPKWGSV